MCMCKCVFSHFSVYCMLVGWHSGAVGSAVASQQEGLAFNSPAGKFACSLHVCVGFLPQSKDMQSGDLEMLN